MTARNDLDARIAAWVNDLPSHAPDGILEPVLAELPAVSQQGRLRAAIRRPLMQTSFRGATSSFAGPLTAALAVVVLVAGAGLLILRGDFGGNIGGPAVTPSASPTAAASPTATPRPTPFDPEGLPTAGSFSSAIDVSGAMLWTSGHGALWASNAQSGELLRIDPATEEVARFEVAAADTVAGDMPVALDDESVWVNAAPQPGLVQVDPETGAVVREIALPDATGGYRLAVNGSTAWLTDFEGNSVLQVDLASGDVVSTTDITGPGGVVVHDGTPWVVSYWTGVLHRLDPQDGSVQEEIRVGLDHMWLIPDGDTFWFAGNQESRLTRFDLPTRDVRSVDPTAFGPTFGLALLDGRVYTATALGGRDELVAFDPETLEPVAWTQAPGPLNQILAVDGTLWVLSEADLHRFDPAP